MNIDEMPAGPDMGKLVAEKVMGWRVRTDGDTWGPYPHLWLEDGKLILRRSSEHRGVEWNPVVNIADAWQVVEHLRSKEAGFGLRLGFMGALTEQASVARNIDIGAGCTPRPFWWFIFLADVPLAICRAALKAKEREANHAE